MADSGSFPGTSHLPLPCHTQVAGQNFGDKLTNQRPRIFYGWWIVATAALGLCLGAAPIIVFAFGVFFKPLGQEYHAGRGAISFAFTLQNLAAALFAPLTGRLIDRFGARKVILPGTAIFGVMLLSFKGVHPRCRTVWWCRTGSTGGEDCALG
ncbi:MAG: MFS transporter [Candidatus Acidiferrum sp.]